MDGGRREIGGLGRGSSRMTLPSRVRIVEVGPRDGLQNEPALLSVDAKVAFIETLARAMHAAHQQQVIHRDLKPANILLQTT